jgi:hypothetical protein
VASKFELNKLVRSFHERFKGKSGSQEELEVDVVSTQLRGEKRGD